MADANLNLSATLAEKCTDLRKSIAEAIFIRRNITETDGFTKLANFLTDTSYKILDLVHDYRSLRQGTEELKKLAAIDEEHLAPRQRDYMCAEFEAQRHQRRITSLQSFRPRADGIELVSEEEAASRLGEKLPTDEHARYLRRLELERETREKLSAELRERVMQEKIHKSEIDRKRRRVDEVSEQLSVVSKTAKLLQDNPIFDGLPKVAVTESEGGASVARAKAILPPPLYIIFYQLFGMLSGGSTLARAQIVRLYERSGDERDSRRAAPLPDPNYVKVAIRGQGGIEEAIVDIFYVPAFRLLVARCTTPEIKDLCINLFAGDDGLTAPNNATPFADLPEGFSFATYEFGRPYIFLQEMGGVQIISSSSSERCDPRAEAGFGEGPQLLKAFVDRAVTRMGDMAEFERESALLLTGQVPHVDDHPLCETRARLSELQAFDDSTRDEYDSLCPPLETEVSAAASVIMDTEAGSLRSRSASLESKSERRGRRRAASLKRSVAEEGLGARYFRGTLASETDVVDFVVRVPIEYPGAAPEFHMRHRTTLLDRDPRPAAVAAADMALIPNELAAAADDFSATAAHRRYLLSLLIRQAQLCVSVASARVYSDADRDMVFKGRITVPRWEKGRDRRLPSLLLADGTLIHRS